MRPTRRGYGALAVAATAVALAVLGGHRQLNAVAAPVLAAVGAGAVQAWRADPPTVERSTPKRGFPGERRTIALDVGGAGVATVTDAVPDGLSARTSPSAERTLPATVEYEVTYERRGVHAFGPTTVRVRDVLGLVEERYRREAATEVVVYPRVYSMGAADAFARTLGPETDDRSAFDRLREYVPGDRLRDVHWKTSAKHDELLVTEFTDPTDEEAISIAAGGDPEAADELAAATATVVVGAIRAGLAVELILPDARLPRGYGETHRRNALELLARTAGGEVPDDAWAAADVRVSADDAGVTVAVGDRTHDLADLTTGRTNPILGEVTA